MAAKKGQLVIVVAVVAILLAIVLFHQGVFNNFSVVEDGSYRTELSPDSLSLSPGAPYQEFTASVSETSGQVPNPDFIRYIWSVDGIQKRIVQVGFTDSFGVSGADYAADVVHDVALRVEVMGATTAFMDLSASFIVASGTLPTASPSPTPVGQVRVTVTLNGAGSITPEPGLYLRSVGEVFHLRAVPWDIVHVFSYWSGLPGVAGGESTDPVIDVVVNGELHITGHFVFLAEQTPVPSLSPYPTVSHSPSPTPSVPEFPALEIFVILLISMVAAAVVVRHGKLGGT